MHQINKEKERMIKIKKQNLNRVMSFVLALLIIWGFIPIEKSNASTATKLADVPLGAIVYDKSSIWEFKTGSGYTGTGEKKPVEWLVMSKNHYASNQVTLLASEPIASKEFDASGRGAWNVSGLRTWLNSTFYGSFSAKLKAEVVDTVVPNFTWSGSSYNTTDKVFLASGNELNILSEYARPAGRLFQNANNANNLPYMSRAWGRSPSRERSPYPQDFVEYFTVYNGRTEGSNGFSDSKSYTVMPVVNLKSTTPVAYQGNNRYEIFGTPLDSTAPTINLTQNVTTPTNGNVTITISATDTSGVKRVQKPDGTWVNGSTATHVVSANGTYTFKAEDTVGNVGSKSITISNIDKVAPTVPSLKLNTTSPTNQNVTVTVTHGTDTGSGVLRSEYKIGSGAWNIYSSPFAVSTNGLVYARTLDKAGNVSSEASINVTNIDKTAPVITIGDYIKTPTNKDITVTATTNKGTLNKTSHTFTQNSSFEFIATDVAGNVTKRIVAITNIDKIPPVITIGDYIKTPTNKDITVTATTNEGTLNKESHTFTENGSFEFIATDEVGNVSKKTVEITNIDRVPPVKPTLEADIEYLTNKDVTVTINYSNDTATKEYKVNDGNWVAYTTPVKIPSNSTIYARGTDLAGNVSEVSSLDISNIDKVLPVITIGDYIKTPTNKDITVTATTDKGTLNKTSHTFTENGSFEFIATDGAGNVTKKIVIITNIDKIPPVITIGDYIKTPTNKDITVTATTNEGTLNKTSHTFTENGSFEFVATDEAGNVTKKEVVVTNIDKVVPIITIDPYNTNWTNKDITVTAKVDKGTLNKNSHTFVENGSFEFIAIDEAGNTSNPVKVTITNIDKVVPTKPKISRSTDGHSLILTPGTDAGSGVDKSIYSINDKEWINFIEEIDLSAFEDGDYQVVFKTIDRAGNESIATIEFTINYQAIKDKIEDDLGDTSIDIDTDLDDLEDILGDIQESIDKLPNGSNKDDLQDILDDLQNKLNNEKDKRLKEATKAVELAEATRREPYIQNAKDKVVVLKDGPEKIALEDRISAIEYVDMDEILLKEAEVGVSLAEATKREPYIGDAKGKIRILPNGKSKENLELRMFKLEEALNINPEIVLKNTENLVSLAEKTKRKTNLATAKETVQRLKPSEEKTNFLIRLEKVLINIEGSDITEEDIKIIEATHYVELAELYEYSFAIRKAYEVVKSLADSQARLELLNRLDNLSK